MWLTIVACTSPPPSPGNDDVPYVTPPDSSDTAADTGSPPDTGTTDTGTPPSQPTTSEATGWIHADAGPAVTCGVRADTTIACWGAQPDIVGTVPYGSFFQVSVGDRHACAITTAPRTVVCWGDDTSGQATPAPGTGWVEISAGGSHTCARRATGTVECWGDDSAGQLALPAVEYDAIAAGATHTCGIARTDGSVLCAGSDAFGESSAPASFGTFNTALATGRSVTCAITSNDYGSACAGDAADLQLSDQYVLNTDIAVGDGFVAVLSGYGYDARHVHGLGNVPWDDGEEPVEDESWYDGVLPSARYGAITAGDRHLCLHAAATQDLVCLGDDAQGQVTIPL